MCIVGILSWEIYSGGKQPYPAINNTEVVQKVGVIYVKHIDEALSYGSVTEICYD